jgi:hypothetical protein
MNLESLNFRSFSMPEGRRAMQRHSEGRRAMQRHCCYCCCGPPGAAADDDTEAENLLTEMNELNIEEDEVAMIAEGDAAAAKALLMPVKVKQPGRPESPARQNSFSTMRSISNGRPKSPIMTRNEIEEAEKDPALRRKLHRKVGSELSSIIITSALHYPSISSIIIASHPSSSSIIP